VHRRPDIEPKIILGIPFGQSLAVAQVLYDSLEEIRIIFGPRDRALRVIACSLREDRTFTSTYNQQVVGIAGLNYGGSPALDVSGSVVFREYRLSAFKVTFLGLPLKERTAPDELYLESLAVSAGYRNRGIGRKLLDVVLEHAAAEGLTRVRLHVVEPNLKAKALYERVGFETSGYWRVPFLWRRAFRWGGYYELIKRI